ncbi:GNAT family N-acetyltransferase [Geodermatophilus sp. SYSU D01186]
MPVVIRPLTDADVEEVVALSLRAWASVFASFEAVLGTAVYRHLYPDWRAYQAAAVEAVCRDPERTVWVADDGRPVGFVALVLHDESYDEPCSGEVEMIAVDPGHQRRGIAAELMAVALERMRQEGMRVAVVATGGDPGHAPARAVYEQAGFTALPLVRYYRAL